MIRKVDGQMNFQMSYGLIEPLQEQKRERPLSTYASR